MRQVLILMSAVIALAAAPLWANDLDDGDMALMTRADVVILGEIHDNPGHHERQAELIRALDAKAVVWEMLTADTAARINAGGLGSDQIDRVLGWAREHWQDFDLYRPVLLAAMGRGTYGGLVPRDAARKAIEIGPAVAFGSDSSLYGLAVPLNDAEQDIREAQQFEAHCDAIPEDMLPSLVGVQRLRDASLARAVLQALDDTGGPVVVITGNGHARKDWGIPRFLDRLRPGARVFSLGQGEGDDIRGSFDAVAHSPAVERPDPCAVFQQKTD